MLIFLYDVAIFFYRTGLQAASFFNHKAKKWIRGRQGQFEHLKHQQFSDSIWFHCASVGEFEQGYPLLCRMKKKYPSSTFLVTFFSPSGYEFAKKRYSDFLIYYLPIDTKQNAIEFIETTHPKAVFFIKYEFWFHYLNELKNRHIPTFLVSGIFRKEQLFFSWYGFLHRKMLASFTYLFLQNEESKTLLDGIGLSRSAIFGDTRFDRVAELKNSLFNDDIINDFAGDSPIFIAGSIWKSDENALKSILSLLPPHWKIILFPHEITGYSVSWLNEEPAYYSQYKPSNTHILLVDRLGVLSKAYRKASFAYIGGGFGKGIHNMLEAAIYEIPIFIGPAYQKFNEAVELIHESMAFDISKKETLKVINRLIQDPVYYAKLTAGYVRYMSEHTNVSAKIEVFIAEQKLIS